MLHNREYRAFSEMCNDLSNTINEFLANSEVYQRIQGYIKLANDNLDKFHSGICQFNSSYANFKLIVVSMNEETFIHRALYEIKLTFYDSKDKIDSTYFGLDDFIIFLDEAGLVKDEKQAEM